MSLTAEAAAAALTPRQENERLAAAKFGGLPQRKRETRTTDDEPSGFRREAPDAGVLREMIAFGARAATSEGG